MTLSNEQTRVLKQIFSNEDVRGKISLVCNPGTRDVVVLFTVLDENWFDALCGDITLGEEMIA